MQKTFDQKWGNLILAGSILFIAGFYLIPVSFGSSEDDDASASGFYSSYYESMTENIYEENGMDPDVEPNWDNIFGKTAKKNGKNLYLLVYNKVKNEPSAEALANTAAYFGYTKDKMINIVDGDLYAIYAYDCAAAEYGKFGCANGKSNLETLDGLTSTYDEIISYYQDQLAVQSLNSELSSTAASQEIFANGNTDDSGFDLIVDLWNIEEILFFGKNEDGYGSGMSTWDGGEEEPADYSDESDGDTTEATSDEPTGESETATDEETVIEPISSDIEDATTSDTSLECFEDSSLSNELADALGSDSGTDSTDGGEEGGGGGTEPVDEGTEDETPDSTDGNTAGTPSIEGPEAADWSLELPCTEVLCLEVNFVSEADEPTEAGMEEDSNCIYCHISYIEKMLDNITSHDLSGGKVTGNALEDATCKEDGANIALNMFVFAIGSPILTPSNDNIIVDVGRIKDDFLSALFPSSGSGDTTSTADEILLRLQNAGETENLVELSELTTELTYAEIDRQIEAMNNFALSSQMGDMSTMYQAVSVEMEQMNEFFYGMESIITGDEDGFVYYLNSILDKSYKN